MREEEGKAERNYYELMIRTSIPHPSKLLDRRTEARSKGVMLSLRERKKKKRCFTFCLLFTNQISLNWQQPSATPTFPSFPSLGSFACNSNWWAIFTSLSQLRSFITLFSLLFHQAEVVREQLVGNWPPAKVNPQPPVRISHIPICILCLSLLPCISEKCSCTSEGSIFSVSSVQEVVNISKICSLIFLSLPQHRETCFSQSLCLHAPPPWQAWVASTGLSPSWYSIFLHYRAQTWLYKCQILGKDGYPLANSHPRRWLATSTTSFPWAIPAPSLQCCFLASPHSAQTGA